MTVSAAILFPAVCTSDTNNAEICHNIIINNPSNRKFIERFWRLKLVKVKALYNFKLKEKHTMHKYPYTHTHTHTYTSKQNVHISFGRSIR